MQRRFRPSNSSFEARTTRAISLYLARYNLCRVQGACGSRRPVVLGIAEQVWTIGNQIDAALAIQPFDPAVTARDRRKRVTGN